MDEITNGLSEYRSRRDGVDAHEELVLLKERMRRRQLRRARGMWIAAASVLLLTGAGGAFWALRPEVAEVELPEIAQVFSQPRATLHVSTGEVFHYDTDSVQQITFENNAEVERHRLDVPKGGEFRMTLPDGTKVWLNSDSSISFPGAFDGPVREVTVRGELYFEVSRDEEHPFIVHAGEMTATVLGTQFGISAYDDEAVHTAILAEGRLRVDHGEQSVTLSPSRKAVLADGELVERQADIKRDLAWIRRDFAFENDRLEDVVRRLERWYPVDFRFADDSLRDYRFTGVVGRDMGIGEILGLIEKMNVVAFTEGGGAIEINKR